MDKKNVLIVEDDVIILEGLKSIINNLGYNAITSINVASSINSLKKYQIDFAFLDINIEGERDGIWLANFINEEFNVPFSYITGNDDENTINRAMITNPSTYLIKPFKQKDVMTSLEIMKNKKYMSEINEESNLGIAQNKISEILFDSILYIEKFDNNIKIYTKNFTDTLFKNIEDVKKILPNNFTLIHPSYIVNSNYILSVESDFIELVGGYCLPIESKYYSELENSFLLIKKP